MFQMNPIECKRGRAGPSGGGGKQNSIRTAIRHHHQPLHFNVHCLILVRVRCVCHPSYQCSCSRTGVIRCYFLLHVAGMFNSQVTKSDVAVR
uniref:Uncharacterized protein n=1 Tax=Octopus bimaculoides TaxID=37653 RepID=A0A0L8FY63_OCTBM